MNGPFLGERCARSVHVMFHTRRHCLLEILHFLEVQNGLLLLNRLVQVVIVVLPILFKRCNVRFGQVDFMRICVYGGALQVRK